jgi:thiamine-phosphate pyrophosphorylase
MSDESDEQGQHRGVNPGSEAALDTRASLAAALSDAPLYAILDTVAFSAFEPESVADALLQGGVRVIQYRHKGPFQRIHFDHCLSLARKVRESGGIFIVNDRADVADLCGADGVHLGQDDLSPEQVRRFLGESRLIGYSTHNVEQARRAVQLPVDYIAIGPVFPTQTKDNADPVVGLAAVAAVRALTNKPLVAIGGITMENAPAVLAAGADGVAVIRGLLGRGLLGVRDVAEGARDFMTALGKPKPGTRSQP